MCVLLAVLVVPPKCDNTSDASSTGRRKVWKFTHAKNIDKSGVTCAFFGPILFDRRGGGRGGAQTKNTFCAFLQVSRMSCDPKGKTQAKIQLRAPKSVEIHMRKNI